MDHALSVLEFGTVMEQVVSLADSEPARGRLAGEKPIHDSEDIKRRLELVGEAIAILDKESVSLVGLKDVDLALVHAAKGRVLSGVDLYAIGWSLKVSRAAAALVRGAEEAPLLKGLCAPIADRPDVENKLLNSLDADGMVRDEASDALAKARAQERLFEEQASRLAQKYLTSRSRDLLSDPIVTKREGKFVIPLKAENRGKVKGEILNKSASGATIFVEPQDVAAASRKSREAGVEAKKEEERVLRALSEQVGDVSEELRASIAAGIALDVVLAKGRYAIRYDCCVPALMNYAVFELEEARHPLIDRSEVVPLTLALEPGQQGMLITGPNTGGKTVSLKCIGLCFALAQCGIPVPAKKMKFQPVTQFWADIGDEQSLQQSLSTFGSHIKQISEALNGLKPGALVILDEVGAGTDPSEGAALGRALLDRFLEAGAWVFASTHYGELKLYADSEPRVINAAMEFDRQNLKPTYRLRPGLPGASHAFVIAQRYGIKADVIEAAKALLGAEHHEVSEMLERLDSAEKRARAAQSQADRFASELSEQSADLARREAKLEARFERRQQQIEEEFEEELRALRLLVQESLETIKEHRGTVKEEEARQAIKDAFRESGKRVRPKQVEKKSVTVDAPKELAIGDRVRLVGLGKEGIVESVKASGQFEIRVGPMLMRKKASELQFVGSEKMAAPKAPRGKTSAKRAATISPELHLRAMRLDEAQETLARYLDDAVLANLDRIRIVHGKGSGALKVMTHDALKSNKAVKRYYLAPADDGGDGVTIAEIG